MFTVLTGAEVYAPEPMGKQDILLWKDHIVRIAPRIKIPGDLGDVRVFNVSDRIVTPGFIDYHNHFLGGGGQNGPSSRVPELPLTAFTLAGITTVVGCLGVDATTRSMGSLLGKADSLEAQGLTAFIYTGATLEHPVPTLTGRVRTDIIYVDKVMGAGEVSLSELGPSYDSLGSGAQYIAQLAAETVLASRIAGKPGVICLQVPNRKQMLEPLFGILDRTGLPIQHFVPAHINQESAYFDQAIKFAKNGGVVDITSSYLPELGFDKVIRPSRAIKLLLESGVGVGNITMSTDGGGARPAGYSDGKPTKSQYLPMWSMLKGVREAVLEEKLPLDIALRTVTSNPARVLCLTVRKGNLQDGSDADLLVLTRDLTLDKVFAKGRLMVDEGQAVVKAPFDDELG